MLTSWQEFIEQQRQQPYFQELEHKVAAERAKGVAVYPSPERVFRAFDLTPLDQVRVVIIGQDPYHGPDQADGLCFSVPAGMKPPPSLRNIYKALQHDFPEYQPPLSPDLTHWAEQGVLLLNTVLTVRDGAAHSHAKWGWETFTDAAIDCVNHNRQGVVFLLWGAHAQKKGARIDRDRHHVLESVHPSPLSAHRGFFSAGHFKQANELLKQPIDW